MENLIRFKKNDIVSLKYGSIRINAIILKNSGYEITWRGVDWKNCYSETFSYPQCHIRRMIYIGRYRPLIKKLFSLNFSHIDFKH